mmetsp:Transcript_6491/g.9279  ORF Transcript_6491/g.9279 Transcript_6491/m.9279 type:complete len:261 (-) Transcript_6491:82-864(-)
MAYYEAETLTAENMSVFWVGIPVLIGLTCLIMSWYFFSVRRHVPLAVSILAWGIIVETVSYRNQLVESMDWNLAQDWPGVLLANALFATPLVAFYVAWQKETFRKFLLSIPPADMISIQASRIAGAAYIYLYFTKDVRNNVTLMVGVFDVLLSTTALPLASYVRSVGAGAAKDYIYMWNVFGITDLLVPFALFPFNLFGVLYNPIDSLSFFFLHPIANVVIFNVPLCMINHFLFLTRLDEMVQESDSDREVERLEYTSIP